MVEEAEEAIQLVLKNEETYVEKEEERNDYSGVMDEKLVSTMSPTANNCFAI